MEGWADRVAGRQAGRQAAGQKDNTSIMVHFTETERVDEHRDTFYVNEIRFTFVVCNKLVCLSLPYTYAKV